MRSALRPMVKYGPADSRCGHPVVSISERLRLSSGHHAYGSAARPLRTQIKEGVVLEPFSTSSAAPEASISRDRVPKSNTGKYKERGNSDPKNMSRHDRIEEFPGENLCLRGGKLFCNGCKEILSYW